MQLITVQIEKPDDTNSILGQINFIKTVEDIHESLRSDAGPTGNLLLREVVKL